MLGPADLTIHNGRRLTNTRARSLASLLAPILTVRRLTRTRGRGILIRSYERTSPKQRSFRSIITTAMFRVSRVELNNRQRRKVLRQNRIILQRRVKGVRSRGILLKVSIKRRKRPFTLTGLIASKALCRTTRRTHRIHCVEALF